MRLANAILVLVFLPAAMFAQVSAAATPAPQPAASSTQLATAGVASSLPQLQQLAENTRVDLARMRVDKWKTDSGNKQQAQTNVSALQRNLTSALPELAAAVQSNPASLAASFKLYRNVNVLYDVLSTVAESAGAFGPKEEYAALATDVQNLDRVRHTIADQLELLANSKDVEIQRMEAQVRQMAAAAAAAPPKKIVVDENEPAPKKPVKKKKPTTAKPAAAAPPAAKPQQ